MLNKLPDISKWKTDNVENISYLFHKCSNLVSMPNISNWNLNKVKNSEHSFTGCSSLNQTKNKETLYKFLSISSEKESSSLKISETIPVSQNSISNQFNQSNSQPEEQSQDNNNNDDDPYDDFYK